MSAEVHISSPQPDECVRLSDRSLVNRRGFLFSAVTLAAAVAVGACGSGQQDSGLRSVSEGGGAGWDASPSPDAVPSSPDNDGTPEANPSPTPEREADVAGYRLDELTPITWTSVQDPELANTIRNPEYGVAVSKDPKAVATSPVDTYHKADVLGIPASAIEGKIVRLALVVQDTELPFGNSVRSLVLPRGTVSVNGREVSLMPRPVAGASGTRLHPFRLRRGPYEVAVVLLASTDPNADLKQWTVVKPQVIQAGIAVENGTFANAHVL
jgi:hypothetical protein